MRQHCWCGHSWNRNQGCVVSTVLRYMFHSFSQCFNFELVHYFRVCDNVTNIFIYFCDLLTMACATATSMYTMVNRCNIFNLFLNSSCSHLIFTGSGNKSEARFIFSFLLWSNSCSIAIVL